MDCWDSSFTNSRGPQRKRFHRGKNDKKFSCFLLSSLKVKNDHRSKFFNLSNWKEEAWKNQGLNGIRTRDLRVTGALLYQLSYEATHWERGQFIKFISPVRSEMMWSIYEIILYHCFLSILALLSIEIFDSLTACRVDSIS